MRQEDKGGRKTGERHDEGRVFARNDVARSDRKKLCRSVALPEQQHEFKYPNRVRHTAKAIIRVLSGAVARQIFRSLSVAGVTCENSAPYAPLHNRALVAYIRVVH